MKSFLASLPVLLPAGGLIAHELDGRDTGNGQVLHKQHCAPMETLENRHKPQVGPCNAMDLSKRKDKIRDYPEFPCQKVAWGDSG